MGLFDFVKDAGASIFGKDEPAKAPSPQVRRNVDPKQLDAMKRTEGATEAARPSSRSRSRISRSTSPATPPTVHGMVDDQAEREKVVLALGNVIGIARVDDRLETKKKAPEAQMYTVVAAGDSLSKIAKKFYGDAGKYTAIFEANKPMLKDPDKIYPGQVLRIPPLAG